MTANTPEEDEYNYHDGYWRCGRNDGCGQKAGWGTDHVGVGACKLHGGKGGRPLEHGIYSDVVREEDRAVLDALEEQTTAAKLEETLNLQIMKLRRAVSLLDDPDRETDFWDTFATLAENAGEGGELEAKEVKALAQMLDTPHRAQNDLMDLIRKTAKDLHKIRPADEEQPGWGDIGTNTEELEEIQEMADDLL